MRTSNFVEFCIGTLLIIFIFLPSRGARKPRYKRAREPSEAQIVASRQKSWEAYLIERAGGHKPPQDPKHLRETLR